MTYKTYENTGVFDPNQDILGKQDLEWWSRNEMKSYKHEFTKDLIRTCLYLYTRLSEKDSYNKSILEERTRFCREIYNELSIIRKNSQWHKLDSLLNSLRGESDE